MGTGVALLLGWLGACTPPCVLAALQSGECENLLDMESGCVLRKKENEELDKKATRDLRLRKKK